MSAASSLPGIIVPSLPRVAAWLTESHESPPNDAGCEPNHDANPARARPPDASKRERGDPLTLSKERRPGVPRVGELSSPKGWPVVCLSLGLAELRPGHRASVDYPPTTARGGEGGSCPACNPRFCTPGPLLSSRRLLVPRCWSFPDNRRPGGAGVVISALRRGPPPVPECSAAGSRIVMLVRLRILSVPSLPCSHAPLQPCGRAGRQARACSPAVAVASCSFQPLPLARKTYGGGLAVSCAVISSYCFVSRG